MQSGHRFVPDSKANLIFLPRNHQDCHHGYAMFLLVTFLILQGMLVITNSNPPACMLNCLMQLLNDDFRD